jgi:hypothetical protein
MTSKGLSTTLVGRKIAPKPGLLRLWPVTEEGSKIDQHYLEDRHLEYYESTIIAAWTERGGPGGSSVVRIACESATGDTREFYLTHVRLLPKES